MTVMVNLITIRNAPNPAFVDPSVNLITLRSDIEAPVAGDESEIESIQMRQRVLTIPL